MTLPMPLPDTGLPRPTDKFGRPIAYIADPDALGDIVEGMVSMCISQRLCQVCGLGFQTEEIVYAIESMLNQAGYIEGSVPLHEACLKLATEKCPAFKRYPYNLWKGPQWAFTNEQIMIPSACICMPMNQGATYEPK